MDISLVFSCLLVGSMLLTSVAVRLLRRLAPRIGLVDDPGDGAYKTHTQATPYGGGVAIWLGVVVPAAGLLGWLVVRIPHLWQDLCGPGGPLAPFLLFPLEPWSPTVAQLFQAVVALVAATALMLLGLIDDRRPLSPAPRFGVQLLAAGLLVLVPEFRLDLPLVPVGVDAVVSVIWITALANAFNFLDNMNGLSAGLAAITLGTSAAMALIGQHLPAALLCLSLCGACIGFLRFNFPRASIFMGDAGGLFLGFLGGAVSLLLYNTAADANSALALLPLAIFVVPLYDLVTVVGLRLRRGLAPWAGDTNHISHRLVAAGLGRTRAVLVLLGLAALFAGACVAAAVAGPAAARGTLISVAIVVVLCGLVDVGLARRTTHP